MMTERGTTFAALLKHYRQAAGLTQEELAERSGLSSRAISDLERGVKRSPYRHTVKQLVAALRLTPADREALDGTIDRKRGPRAATPQRQAVSPRPLPADLTVLVGRHEESVRGRELLRRARLVTLVGVGGVGKTRLALTIARLAAPDYDGRVIFVPLAAITDPLQVPRTIAQACGLDDDGNLGDSLRQLLAGVPALLLLDNFEQVIDAAPVLSELLQSTEDLTLLVTSREPLRLRGESLLDVAPLALPPADLRPTLADATRYPSVVLFLQLVHAVRPDLALEDNLAGPIVSICRRLDGLPLAMELVAPQLRTLSLAQLASRLTERLPTLVEGPRDLPARQQTMHAALQWSYDLLSSREQRLFRCASVFVGGITLEPLTAIAGEETDPALVRALADKSLLQRVEGPEERYTMLEVVREFGVAVLARRGELDAARRAHARFYCALGARTETEIRGAGQATCLHRLEQDYLNIAAALHTLADAGDYEHALALAADLAIFWHAGLHAREGREWYERLLTAAGAAGTEVPAEVRAAALGALGRSYALGGEGRRAAELYKQSLALYEAMGDKGGMARQLNNLGGLAHYRGDYVRAADLFAAALALRREQHDTYGAGIALNNLALASMRLGDEDRARVCLHEARALLGAVGERQALGSVTNSLGQLAERAGDLTAATDYYAESLQLKRSVADMWGTAMSLTSLGTVSLRRRRLDDAHAYFAEALRLAWGNNNMECIPGALEGLGRVAAARGQEGKAVTLLTVAAHLRAEHGLPAPQGEGRELEAVHDAIRVTLGAAYDAALLKAKRLTVDEVVEALEAEPVITSGM